MKQHLKGFIAAVLVLIACVGGYKGYQLYKVLSALETLTQTAAVDQKTGNRYSVADILTEMAAQKVQEVVAQQKAAPAQK